MYMDRILIKNLLYDNYKEKNIINNNLPIFNNCIKKKVKFDNIIKVILIPNREEYFNNSLNDLLWWKKEDYCNFKKNFLLELNIVFPREQHSPGNSSLSTCLTSINLCNKM